MLFQTCMAFFCETQNKEFWEMSQWFILYKWSYMFDYQNSNIFFNVSQKKVSHTGLELHESQ